MSGPTAGGEDHPHPSPLPSRERGPDIPSTPRDGFWLSVAGMGVGGRDGSCAEGSFGGAAGDDLDAGGAFQSVVQEFGRAASFQVGDDTGVEGEGAARADRQSSTFLPRNQRWSVSCTPVSEFRMSASMMRRERLCRLLSTAVKRVRVPAMFSRAFLYSLALLSFLNACSRLECRPSLPSPAHTLRLSSA